MHDLPQIFLQNLLRSMAALSAAFGSLSTNSNCLNGKFDMHDWIIDIWYSHLVTDKESCLLDVQSVSPCTWGLSEWSNNCG